MAAPYPSLLLARLLAPLLRRILLMIPRRVGASALVVVMLFIIVFSSPAPLPVLVPLRLLLRLLPPAASRPLILALVRTLLLAFSSCSFFLLASFLSFSCLC